MSDGLLNTIFAECDIYTTGKKYGIFFISAIYFILRGVLGISLFDLRSYKQISLLGS